MVYGTIFKLGEAPLHGKAYEGVPERCNDMRRKLVLNVKFSLNALFSLLPIF
jgi:hypothetical protein